MAGGWDERGSRCICLGATDAMLFQMQLSGDKGMGTILDSLCVFFLICEKYSFSSIFYVVLFLYLLL